MVANGNARFTKLFDLTGRTALITGGSVGFGKVISLGLAEYGCNVAVADLDLEAAKSVASEVAQHSRSLGISVDVSDPTSVKGMVAKTIEEFGTVDILV